jgi:hypothetical protein
MAGGGGEMAAAPGTTAVNDVFNALLRERVLKFCSRCL